MSTERRLHAPALETSGGIQRLSREASKHARVLRLGVGDPVVLFDGQGRRADAVIESIEDGIVVCLAGPAQMLPRAVAEVHLVQALPKRAVLEDVVRMTTELGIASIRLADSAHAVTKLDEERGEKRVMRLRKIAEEAARQCERDDVPDIEETRPLRDVARLAPPGATRLVLCGRTGTPMPDVLNAPVWLVVGPEGGLSPEEVTELCESGYQAISLGPTTLRVATAATAAVAICLARSRR